MNAACEILAALLLVVSVGGMLVLAAYAMWRE